MNKIIFISGGGTGGHLFPAICIGEELIKNNFSIIFIGSKFGIEKEYFKRHNLKHYLLNIRGIQRSLSIKSIISTLTSKSSMNDRGIMPAILYPLGV